MRPRARHGPRPRSTSQLDWYNWISKAPFDPTNVKQDDGVDGPDDDAKYADELSMDKQGFLPRTLAGIDVEWKLVNIKEAVPASGSPAKPAVPSVGSIVKVDGAAVTATTAAVGKTDSAGKSCVTLYSEKIGQTKVQAVATYAGNPYPKLLFNHDTVGDDWWHDYDWDEQPAQYFLMTWIPHVIGGDTGGPITPAYALNNTGEMEIFTLELKDEFGNPIKDYTVRWTLQGVGYFKSDGSTTVRIAEENVDIDVTGVDGKASVMVESLVPGESVIHCKVMDKYGLPWKEWNVVKQWYSIDEVVLGYVDSKGVWQNSAANPVNSSHTWIAKVSGAKLVHVLWDVNRNGKNDDVALLAPKADLKAAEGFVMKWVDATLRWVHKPAGEEVLPARCSRPTSTKMCRATPALPISNSARLSIWPTKPEFGRVSTPRSASKTTYAKSGRISPARRSTSSPTSARAVKAPPPTFLCRCGLGRASPSSWVASPQPPAA